MDTPRRQQRYDHRLIELVRRTGDVGHATRRGVPRSTAAGWLAQRALDVVTLPHLVESEPELRLRVTRLEKRVERLRAMLAVSIALLRILQPDLTRLRVPNGSDKRRLLRALERARGVFGLRRVLRAIGLSSSRLASWRRAARGCELDDESSCPAWSPQRLTAEEVTAIGDMVISPSYRHVPTGRLAVLAQRLGTVFASASTWYRLVRDRGWRRPRRRVHPAGPKLGIRATKPNELWHIDATVIRLLDGSKAYVHAVIDNFSRRILSWRVHDRLDAGSSVQVLVEAGESIDPDLTPKLLADAGSENRNASVNQLIEAGLLTRVLAMVDINFSNSLIEAWWRVLKHNWLFLHPLDSVASVRKLVGFYVEEHNSSIPHSAFKGPTPTRSTSAEVRAFQTGSPGPERARGRTGWRRTERSSARCVHSGGTEGQERPTWIEHRRSRTGTRPLRECGGITPPGAAHADGSRCSRGVGNSNTMCRMSKHTAPRDTSPRRARRRQTGRRRFRGARAQDYVALAAISSWRSSMSAS
jgi:transposase InsO family protein